MCFGCFKRKTQFRNLKHSRKQQPRTQASTSAENQINSDAETKFNKPSATISDKLVQASSPGESSVPPPLASKVADITPIRDLWDLAYENLRKEDEGLVVDYEAKICVDLGDGLSSTLGLKANMRDRMQAILQLKVDEIDRNKWKLKVGGSEIQTQDLLQPVLGTIRWANDFIGQAVSANPYASIAWAGVGLLLPIFLNPSEQSASLAGGLEYISSLIVQSRMWEDHYAQRYESGTSQHDSSSLSHTTYRYALEELYRQILKFQATSYCYYAQNAARRLGQDTIKWYDWDGLLIEIRNKKSRFDEVTNNWRNVKDEEESLAADKRHQEAIRCWQDLGTQVSKLQEAVQVAQAEKEEKKRKELLDWLCTVDPSQIYNTAQDNHKSGTCDWLVRDSERFKVWERSPRSLLWLFGKAGSGKSILSSSVIKYLHNRCASDPKTAFAYFFFSFSDKEKQNVAGMLSSLVKQLYAGRPIMPRLTENLSEYMHKGQRPDTRALEDALMATTSGFLSVFIVIDALDECPILNRERRKLLGSLSRIIATMPDNLHVFCTSRAEPDISTVISAILSPPSRDAINLTVDQLGVNRDIGLYIESMLASRDYSSWPKYLKVKAKDLLIEKADGMFQYVSCQLDALCNLRSERHINDALQKLPSGLDATYDRLLRDIDIDFQAQVVGLLKWLAFSNEVLRIEQLAEIFILRPERTVAFDVAERLFRPEDCLEYVPSLVITYKVPRKRGADNDRHYVRLAHFSVKEYLMSGRIAEDLAAVFQFTEYDAHLYIAHSCLAINLHCTVMSETSHYSFRLEDYAARNWILHLEMVPYERWPAEVACLAARALAVRSESLRKIIMRASVQVPHQVDTLEYLLRPQCFTARLGLLELTRMLLSGDTGTNRYLTQVELDAALLQAASSGSIAVVKFLLGKGAHVNAENDTLGCPLWAASSMGHESVVELLLNNGADVNAQHSTLGSALQAAAASGRLQILRLLVRRGADVNLPSHKAGCVLTSVITVDDFVAWADRNASSTECLRFLLDNGAKINSNGGIDGTALHKAAARLGIVAGARDCFNLLLERGADVNAHGGEYGYPLQAACANIHIGSTKEVEFLLERGADINAQGGKYGNALQAACHAHNIWYRTHDSIVKLLLDKGADVNMQGGELGTALQAACKIGGSGLSKVEFLLEQGADVNIQGGTYGNALQAACYAKSLEGAQLLLKHGANVNAQGGKYGNALQAACSGGHLEIARLLLDQGADVNAPGGEYGGALHAAAAVKRGIYEIYETDETDLLELLISRGAHVNKLGGHYGTALQYACFNANVECMRLLLRYGADVHVQAGKFGSAWHTATAGSHLSHDALQLLLGCGADINDTRGREYATALQAAIDCRHGVDRIGFLLDHGADINVKAGTYGSLLQSACAIDDGRSLEFDNDWWVVEFLLQNCPGIDVNEEGGLFGSALQAAAYSGQADSVKLLLDKGAHIDTRGGKYGSALNAAIVKGFWDIVEVLLDHGAKSDRQRLPKPDEEWLACVQEEDGGEAVERYRIFWEKQVVSEDAI